MKGPVRGMDVSCVGTELQCQENPPKEHFKEKFIEVFEEPSRKTKRKLDIQVLKED